MSEKVDTATCEMNVSNAVPSPTVVATLSALAKESVLTFHRMAANSHVDMRLSSSTLLVF